MRSPTARRLHHQADHRRGYRFLEQARELIAKIKELHSRIQPEPPKAMPLRKRHELAKGLPGSPHRRGGDWRVHGRAQHAGRGDLRDPRGLPGAGADRPAHASRLHELFAERLDTLSPLRIREAVSESSLRGPGVDCAGDYHLALTREVVKLLTHKGPLENSCRPAVDVLFRSAAQPTARVCWPW